MSMTIEQQALRQIGLRGISKTMRRTLVYRVQLAGTNINTMRQLSGWGLIERPEWEFKLTPLGEAVRQAIGAAVCLEYPLEHTDTFREFCNLEAAL